MPKLSFYDVAAKKSFTTDKFNEVTIKGRRFAKTTSPLTGNQAFRTLKKK